VDTWTLLQLADSAFPTGAFAHSAGLEAAVQLGRVSDAVGLAGFVEEVLWSAGRSALPFVAAGLRAPEALPALDARCDAATPGHVANRASRAQGLAFLRVAAEAFGGATEMLALRARQAGIAGHIAPSFGAVLGTLGTGEREACRLFLFGAARGLISAAVRIGAAGPLEGQRLLARQREVAESVLVATAGLAPEAAASAAPLLDLLQAHQDRLYSRLFQS